MYVFHFTVLQNKNFYHRTLSGKRASSRYTRNERPSWWGGAGGNCLAAAATTTHDNTTRTERTPRHSGKVLRPPHLTNSFPLLLPRVCVCVCHQRNKTARSTTRLTALSRVCGLQKQLRQRRGRISRLQVERRVHQLQVSKEQ